MNNPLGISPSKGKQGTTQGKEKIFWPRCYLLLTLCGSLFPFTRAKNPVGYSWVQVTL